MKHFILFLLSFFILSSCAIHSGMMTGSAAISDSNYRSLGELESTIKTTHVLGIGGLSKKDVIKEAKRKMYYLTPILKGQTIGNVSVDVKKTFVFPVVVTRYTLTAELIDFNLNRDIDRDTAIVRGFGLDLVENHGMQIGDSVNFVMNGRVSKGKIYGFSKNHVKLKYANWSGKLYSKKTPFAYTVIKQSSSHCEKMIGFGVGEKVLFLDEKNKWVQGQVFGINTAVIGIKFNFNENDSFEWEFIPIGRVKKLN